jgi:predicted MPP superfamily phosphohydrolase
MNEKPIESEANEFQWLHLSDLHVGLAGQGWLWPTLKHALRDDLANMHAKIGAWDTVIFSGDLTQRGAREEFDKLDEILSELWEQFKKLGFSPNLLVIPGNHDIARPNELSPELRVLKKWWDEPDIHDGFFASPSSQYRQAVGEILGEYQAWQRRRTGSDISFVETKSGLLPGDQSAVIKKNDLRLGLVGLNSTWLQIDGADYKGKLHVDARQLQSVTGGDPVAWCNANTFNLLITHHPVDWLHADSRGYWRSDINPPGRFDAHLYGHMHEPITHSTSTAGSLVRNSIQAASLFGLTFIQRKLERIHGYSAGRLTNRPDEQEMRIWPRRLQDKASGERTLGPDTTFILDESDNNSYAIFCRSKTKPVHSAHLDEIVEQSSTSLAVFPALSAAEETLRKVRYHIPVSPAHQNVRTVEQRHCLEILAESRAMWIVSDWGMGDDGFLSSVRQKRGDGDRPIYRLDLSDYLDRDQLFNSIKRKLNCSLERFCELISNIGPNTLLLDNISIAPADDGVVAPETDLEEVVKIILEYCPTLTVFGAIAGSW